MVQNGVLLAQNGDVMVSAVHGGAHQVGCTGVQTDVLAVDVLLVQDGGDQMAVGSQHEAAQLGEDGDVIHALGGQNLLVLLADAFTDEGDVAGGLLGTVVNADAAGEVDEGEVAAGGIAQTDSQTEQLGSQLGVVAVVGGVGSKEGVDAEVLDAQGHHAVDGTCHLVLGHAVLGVTGHIHDGVAQGEGSAGIVAQADGLGHLALADTLQELHVGGVVQVDVSAQIVGLLHVLDGGDVGGEHDVLAHGANGLGHHQLGVGGAVTAAALFLQDLQDVGVGGGLHGEVLPVAGVPGKGFLQCTGVGTDTGLVIQVEGGGMLGGDLLGLFKRHKRCLLHNLVPLSRRYRNPYVIRHGDKTGNVTGQCICV